MKKIFISLLFFTLSLLAKNDAVILLYHHVSTTTPLSTSVTPETLKKHLDYLKNNGFTVLPLTTILSTLKQKKELPPKSIAITFDDAYDSILHNALPLLKEKGYAFTVFVNTQSVLGSYKNILTWDELKILQKNKGTIANHTSNHPHMVRYLKDESKKEWESRIKLEITKAQKLLKEKLGVSNNLFAYPYGEYNKDVQNILQDIGYIGLAQQSGAIGQTLNTLEIPRFPMATNYSNMKRFATSVNSKQLPVKNVKIGMKILLQNETSEHFFSFELLKGDYRKEQLACYSSSGEKLLLSLNDMKVNIRLPSWSVGRKKINCTAPSKTQKGVFYWYSQLWLIKHNDGTWYKE